MNILVTGATGFIGRRLTDFLTEGGHSVSGISSKPGDAKFVCDLADSASVETLHAQLSGKRWDSIVHLASVLSNESTDDGWVFDTNLAITRNLIGLCKQVLPDQLIHASSIAVYPNQTGTFSETAGVRPSENAEGIYGLSKVCAENLLDHQLRGTPIDVLHLRLAQVWGDGMRTDRIMSIMATELRESGTITVFGNGERQSNFIHVDRLCDAIGKLLRQRGVAGIYNVGQESLSYLQLAERVAAAGGAGTDVIRKVERGSTARFELDTTKFDGLLASFPED